MNETRPVVANDKCNFLVRILSNMESVTFKAQKFYLNTNHLLIKDRKTRHELFTFEEVENVIRHVYEYEGDDAITSLIEPLTY